ncbi:GLPGLI family protein [Elizabethkingia ursingii]|uniref:GLPGLI family protein n=1 Tax=Elizabethkingia ursingii TaxID=1756150 RepID=UPI002012DDCF|nr:GLPGLI family protein [Elizabethkingia ursingii]MCL1666785.1 GLPGLI family protein [Elizabethkingia ursingii]
MNKVSLFFILVFALTNAQTHRFFYELKYKNDSTMPVSKKKFMVLDINPKEIKYYDYAFLEKDSINKARNSQDTNWTDQIPVVRKRGTQKNINYTTLEFQIFSYETEDPVKWTLSNDINKYSGYDIQKATSDFGGRKWTAWFTKEIPFSEGPYKFQGLPGLILLLEDSEQQFIFSLVKSKKLNEVYDTSNILEVRYGNKPIPVSEKLYTSKAIEHFNDPFHKIREDLRNGRTTSYEDNGVTYTKAEQLIPLIQDEQEYILKYNNPIERNKAIKYPIKQNKKTKNKSD